MAEIEFDTDKERDKIEERSTHYLSRVVVGNKNTSFLIQAVKKIGIAQNDTQAFYILLGIAIVSFILAMIITIYLTIDSTQQASVPEDIPPWLKEHIENKKI